MLKDDLKQWISEYLRDTDYELITLDVSAGKWMSISARS